jgi:hypothetical protein
LVVVYGRDTSANFLVCRIRGRLSTGNNGIIQAEALHADVKFFDLVYSADADFNRMKPGSHEMWKDVIHNCTIEVSDFTSGQYVGRLELAEKDKLKNREFLFVFPDGSSKHASSCFSSYNLLKPKD